MTYGEEYRHEQSQTLDPIPVHIASSTAKPIRPVSPEYAACNTWSIDTLTNMGKPTQLLARRYRRDKAFISIASLGPVGAANSAQGNVTSPGAAATIASIPAASIIPGTYTIQWVVGFAAGTPAAADVNNFRLAGASGFATSSNELALAEYPQPNFGPIFLNGLNAVTIKSVGAGTVGVQYTAALTLIPQPATTGAQLVLNHYIDPLTNPTPQGFTVLVAPYVFEWRSQQACYAVLNPVGNGPVTVSVVDYAYEEA
jgi:hypothetical protein